MHTTLSASFLHSQICPLRGYFDPFLLIRRLPAPGWKPSTTTDKFIATLLSRTAHYILSHLFQQFSYRKSRICTCLVAKCLPFSEFNAVLFVASRIEFEKRKVKESINLGNIRCCLVQNSLSSCVQIIKLCKTVMDWYFFIALLRAVSTRSSCNQI